MAAIRALDRKLTDGLNLVHDQFAVTRTERQEDREEFREFRSQHREDFRELRAEIKRVDERAEQRTKESEARINQRFEAVEVRLGRLEKALLDLTAQMNKSLERSSGTRRLVWGVLGAASLLLAGGLIRPLFERAVAALLGG